MQSGQVTVRLSEEQLRPPIPRKRRVMWTLGNVLMLAGAYVLLYVGGLLADERYHIYTASGDNDVNLPAAVDTGPAPAEAVARSTPAEQIAPPPQIAPPDSNTGAGNFNVPALNTGGSELTSAVPPSIFNNQPSTVTRVVIPHIEVDKKVVGVGYTTKVAPNGQQIIEYDVDKYRVGHHEGTSNPGGGGNIVLSGHSGGTAYPFNDLYYLEAGDVVQLYSNNQLYDYKVTERHVVDEVGQPFEKQLENAQFIQQTPNEVVTMVTCWPLSDTRIDGKLVKKFTQRVIVRAEPTKPAGNVTQAGEDGTGGAADNWIAR